MSVFGVDGGEAAAPNVVEVTPKADPNVFAVPPAPPKENPLDVPPKPNAGFVGEDGGLNVPPPKLNDGAAMPDMSPDVVCAGVSSFGGVSPCPQSSLSRESSDDAESLVSSSSSSFPSKSASSEGLDGAALSSVSTVSNPKSRPDKMQPSSASTAAATSGDGITSETSPVAEGASDTAMGTAIPSVTPILLS